MTSEAQRHMESGFWRVPREKLTDNEIRVLRVLDEWSDYDLAGGDIFRLISDWMSLATVYDVGNRLCYRGLVRKWSGLDNFSNRPLFYYALTANGFAELIEQQGREPSTKRKWSIERRRRLQGAEISD